MKSKKSLLAALLIGTVIAVFTIGAALPNGSAFEYKLVERNSRDPEALLNAQGKEGWELIAITGHTDGGVFTYYLKRQIR